MAGCTVALKDAFFLGNTMMGSEIFLRPCYVDTMKAIQLCEMERPGAVKVIIGTPGEWQILSVGCLRHRAYI